MKKLSVILILALFSAAFAGAYLDYFHAKSEDGQVKIEWRTGEEPDVKEFVLERKSVNGPYMPIASLVPRGSNSVYEFVDDNAFKTEDVVFIYRLKIVGHDGSNTYSSEVSVSHSISGVKRTWGSIKAMFR